MAGEVIQPLLCFSSRLVDTIQAGRVSDLDRLGVDCESLISAVELINEHAGSERLHQVVQILEQLRVIITLAAEGSIHGLGRPQIRVPAEAIEELLWLKFSVPKIAGIFKVSVSTIRNRMRANELAVSQTYTNIDDEELHQAIAAILNDQPNTGSKLMKGMLWNQRKIRIPEGRLREAMRTVDPWGVHERLLRNRAVVRRSYFVKYSHSIWHMDTNMKLIRYKIVIRGCLDGKSRFCIYLDVGNNNRASSTLQSFLNGVHLNCVPSRTRSDKGGENVLVARFMIETRGVDRGSHLTGKSVHNQRIERFWGDVYRATGYYYETFFEMELAGILDIDNPLHLLILHHVYLPRIQSSLDNFRRGWNFHPISTEHNCTPEQLLYMHLSPSEEELILSEDDIIHSYLRIDGEADVHEFEEENPIRNPQAFYPELTSRQQDRLNQVDVLRDSPNNGIDVFMDCLNSVLS